MKSFIVLTFALLGWAWYALSGGAEFEPGTNRVELPNLLAGGFATQAEARPVPSDAAPSPEVTRASTASLADVSTPVAESPVPVSAASAGAIDVSLAAVPAQPISASFEPESAVAAAAAPADVEEAVAAALESADADLREVTGTRVNLRYGPGTDYSVVGQLAEGDSVEILADDGNGWVKLQARDGSAAGWMYDAYLSAAN